ncbi:TPA: hypothetical protein DDX30_02905 [Candidatus Wolfebacteria bacterium]|nr:hypothetical protein [Candidatus Wolfebacteria bacterium]
MGIQLARAGHGHMHVPDERNVAEGLERIEFDTVVFFEEQGRSLKDINYIAGRLKEVILERSRVPVLVPYVFVVTSVKDMDFACNYGLDAIDILLPDHSIARCIDAYALMEAKKP